MTKHSDGELSFQLRHTMIPVKDMARSVDFYCRIFGMKVLRQRPPDAKGRALTYVGYGDEDSHTVLELIGGTDAQASPWGGHIAIYVSDLEKLCDRLRAAGAKFSTPFTKFESGNRKSTVNVYDPDGIELELSEPR